MADSGADGWVGRNEGGASPRYSENTGQPGEAVIKIKERATAPEPPSVSPPPPVGRKRKSLLCIPVKDGGEGGEGGELVKAVEPPC